MSKYDQFGGMEKEFENWQDKRTKISNKIYLKQKTCQQPLAQQMICVKCIQRDEFSPSVFSMKNKWRCSHAKVQFSGGRGLGG